VSYRESTCAVLARPATPAEADEVMRTADTVYVGYRKYRERVTARRVRIFVLEPVADAAGASAD
jgi:hypothetical protein